MDLFPFKQDIDELIHEFSQAKLTTFSDMKRVWLSRKFSYIFEASPSTNLAFFMQTLYAHTIGYIARAGSLSSRLGGLYCLYSLYETQPFKPPFKIYLSLGELRRLKALVVDAKENGIKVVSLLVKRMLESNMFLFGSVDINESCVTERLNQLTDLQNARVQVAYRKLFDNTKIEQFLHMDMGMEVDLNKLKKMSTEYAEAKKLAIQEARQVVDVQNIEHISEEKQLIGDAVEEIAENWNIQREIFYQQTRFDQQPPKEQHEQQEDDEEHSRELEKLLTIPNNGAGKRGYKGAGKRGDM